MPTDGTAHIRLPEEPGMHGRWEMTKGGYRVAGMAAVKRLALDHEPWRILATYYYFRIMTA